MSVATSTPMALSEKHFNQIINTNAKLKLSPAISVHNTTQLAIVAPSHYTPFLGFDVLSTKSTATKPITYYVMAQ